jgi:hypothetical protein
MGAPLDAGVPLTVVADPAMRRQTVAIARQLTVARFGRHGRIQGLVGAEVRRARSQAARHERSAAHRGVRHQVSQRGLSVIWLCVYIQLFPSNIRINLERKG